MKKQTSLWTILAAPLVIALLSLLGLVSTLSGAGLPDALSWMMLAIPLAAVAWAMKARRS